MLGAIIGDIIGSRFEFNNVKIKDFELFTEECEPTDDSIMTLALAKAIMNCNGDYSQLSKETVLCMQELGNLYPDADYGGMFYHWLESDNPQPYNSFGNGSAMRVSPCAFAAKSLDEALTLAKITAEVTHNHPEGIKGAQAVAAAIFMARNGHTISEISRYVNENFYKIDFTLDSIRKTYRFDVTCQGSVPQALQAFFESVDFEDAIRNAVSIGGDSDTIAAITGSVAEAYYGIPADIRNESLKYLDKYLLQIVETFEMT